MLAGWSRLDHFRRSVNTRRGWEDPLPGEVTAARDLFTRAMAPARRRVAARPARTRRHLPVRAATASTPASAALDRAARLLPADDEIAADLILLHAHAGNQDLSWEMRRERLLGRVAPELDAMVEKLLVEEALRAANRLLLIEQKPEPALALVRGAAAEVRDPVTRREIEDLLAQTEQVAAMLSSEAVYERFLAVYEKARSLVAERRFDEARRLLEPYAAETMDPPVREQARDALQMIDQVDR